MPASRTPWRVEAERVLEEERERDRHRGAHRLERGRDAEKRQHAPVEQRQPLDRPARDRVRRLLLGQHPTQQTRARHGEPGREVDRCRGSEDRQHRADARSDGLAEPHRRVQERDAGRALLVRRPIGDVGLRCRAGARPEQCEDAARADEARIDPRDRGRLILPSVIVVATSAIDVA
jgi:hypothetical protein